MIRLLLSGCLLLAAASSLAADDYLIRIYYDGDPARLADTSFIPYAAYDDFAIGEASAGYSRVLKGQGFHFDVLAEDPGRGTIWQTDIPLASLPPHAEVRATLAPGVKIVTLPLGASLRTSPRTMRLRPTTIDFNAIGRASRAVSFTPNDDVKDIVAGVTRAVFEDHVYNLAAFGTRYSYSSHCKEAAAYIEQELTAAGYRITRDLFIGPALPKVAAAGPDVAWAAGQLGLIARTADGGAHWVILDPPRDTEALSIAATSADDAWVGYSDGIIMSTRNGGVTWTEAALGDDGINDLFFLDADTGWAVDDWGGIYRTRDGVTWEKTTTLNEWIWCIAFGDENHGVVTGSDGYLAHTADGGEHWNWLRVGPSSAPPKIRAAAFRTPTEVFAVGEGGTFLRSADRGATWQSLPLAGARYLYDVAFNNGVGFVVGPPGMVYRTADGQNWQCRQTPFFNLTSAAMGSRNNLWCGTEIGGALLRSEDGGLTWDDQIQHFDPDSPYVWANIMARKAGGGDGTVMVTAHYDSINQKNSSPYYPDYPAPGADDNASGVSAVLSLARACRGHDFRRDLLFVLYCGEEQTLFGSRHLAPTLAYAGEPITAIANPDMIAYQDKIPEDGNLFTNRTGAWWVEYQRRAAATYVPGLALSTTADPAFWGSDHSPYWNFGIASSLLIDDDPVTYLPYYHTDQDIPENIDFAFGTLMAKAIAAGAASLASPTSAPASPALAALEVYPNPYRYPEHRDRVFFAHLPPHSRITLYTIAGEKIAEEQSGNEEVWSLDMGGRLSNVRFHSGVLLYHIETPAGEKTTGKLAIIR